MSVMFLSLTPLHNVPVHPDTVKESRELRTMLNSYSKNMLLIILTIVLSAGAIFGQTSGFTYQGRLTDGGIPANGNYDLQFALFDAADGSNQIGQTKTVSSVPVSTGIFTVTLDFGASAFTGANRFLEISARPSGAAGFTLLTPRQPITATPYALRTLNSATADNAQQLAGVAASQYVKTDDARLTDARDPKAGNSNYVQNSTSQQAATNFNISGNGSVGGTLSGNTVNAATQYNLGGQTVLGLSQSVLKLGNSGNVAIGQSSFPNYKLDIESPDKNGLRIGAGTPGGTALSLGGFGAFEVDSNGLQAGRFVVAENGNVGIGTPNPAYKLTVAGGSFLGGNVIVGGTVESTGGFKFADGSVQTNAVGKVYTANTVGDVEVDHSGRVTDVATLTLPPGVYLVTVTVFFENRATDLFQDNTRVVRCFFGNEFLGADQMGAPINNGVYSLTFNAHTVFTQFGNGTVSLRCGNLDDRGKVFARNRRFTAVRMGDNPN